MLWWALSPWKEELSQGFTESAWAITRKPEFWLSLGESQNVGVRDPLCSVHGSKIPIDRQNAHRICNSRLRPMERDAAVGGMRDRALFLAGLEVRLLVFCAENGLQHDFLRLPEIVRMKARESFSPHFKHSSFSTRAVCPGLPQYLVTENIDL